QQPLLRGILITPQEAKADSAQQVQNNQINSLLAQNILLKYRNRHFGGFYFIQIAVLWCVRCGRFCGGAPT
ncbi:MAG: hypothetical protein J6Q06_03065, partial [Clostridia bacterium]|nr:hypothetical protein [Clostridia bacterium]